MDKRKGRLLVWISGGGKGFIGQRLVQLLREKGFQSIWIVSRKTDGKGNTLTWVYRMEFLRVDNRKVIFNDSTCFRTRFEMEISVQRSNQSKPSLI